MIQWDTLNSIINPDKKIFKFALKKDDIVLTSKSSKVKIAIVDCETKDNIILTGGMLCIRPNTDLIKPEYLKMFLDSKKGKEILADVDLLLLNICTQCTKLLTIIVVFVVANGYPTHTYNVQSTMKLQGKKLNDTVPSVWA